MADFKKALAPTKKKGATEAQFAAAQSAAAEVDKALGRASALAKESREHGSWVSGVRNKLATDRRAIDARQIAVAVARQKARIGDAQNALTASLAKLKAKNVPDSDFKQAEASVSRIEKLLDGGKDLESKDSGYRSYAAKVSRELGQASRRIDAQWAEVGLERAKAEIEPARADLVRASKALRGKPTQEQFAEARSAAFVVQKLLEKFGHLESKSRAFRQYADGAREAVVDLQRRRVELERVLVTDAVKSLWDKGVSDASFVAVETVIKKAEDVLEQGKSLEKDRKYAGYVREVKKRFRDARAKADARKLEVEVARQKATIQAARSDLQKALRPLQRRSPTGAQFAEARTAAIVFQKTLESSSTKDRKLAQYVNDQKTWLKAATRGDRHA